MAAEIHNTSDFLNILPLGAEQRRNPVVLPNVAWVPVAQVDSCPHRTQKLELQNAKKQKKTHNASVQKTGLWHLVGAPEANVSRVYMATNPPRCDWLEPWCMHWEPYIVPKAPDIPPEFVEICEGAAMDTWTGK